MEARGQTPKRLAREAGVGETYVRDILTGRSLDPKTGKLALIAQALDCTLEELLRPEPPSLSALAARVEPPENVAHDEQELLVLKIWRLLGHNEKLGVMALLRAGKREDAA